MAKTKKNAPVYAPEHELRAFSDGHSTHAWECFGAHAGEQDGVPGYYFRVWAPNAQQVCVFGYFNDWDPNANPLTPVQGGIWEGFIPGLQQYDAYKYAVHTKDGRLTGKADPFAFHAETRPGTASKLYDLSGYQWGDRAWLDYRAKNAPYRRPMNIYECHLGSWRRTGEGEFLSYRDLAAYLVPYVKELGFTHVELLPVTEHPLDASWGYQCTGYFAATSRFGTPHDLMYFVDQMHQAGIGVIMDWVPAHFPRDEFHFDGLRVDAVSSRLYLDYARKPGEWIPNIHGGKENLEAIEFLQRLNEMVFGAHPDVLMIAEESTAWPKVTYPVSDGGLGFNFKWNMGWMNDICHYIKLDPYFRQFNHRDITFSLMYAFSENYILPRSHDEVVHMKGSFLGKMPGENHEKFAGVRAFYAYMLTHPGKKLSFMGAELGQWNEWHYEYSLDWHLLQYEPHRQIHKFFQAANAFYLAEPALWEQDDSWQGFQWLCADDHTANTVAFLRWDREGRPLIVVCNFSPIHRKGYYVGAPFPGTWAPVLNTDAEEFGGSGLGDAAPIKTVSAPCHDQEQALSIDLPPMSVMVYRCIRRSPVRKKKAGEKEPEKKRAPRTGTGKAAPAKTAARKSKAAARPGHKPKTDQA